MSIPCSLTISFTYIFVSWSMVQEVSRLYEQINDYQNGIMHLCSPQKTNDKVYCDLFPLPLRNLIGFQKSCWLLVFCFDLLISETLCHKLDDIRLHSKPPIIFLQVSVYFFQCQDEANMGLYELQVEFLLQIFIIWYTYSILNQDDLLSNFLNNVSFFGLAFIFKFFKSESVSCLS